MDCPFVVGQRVVCLQQYAPNNYDITLPRVGDVYTIRSIVIFPFLNLAVGDCPALLFREFVNAPLGDNFCESQVGRETAFPYFHFRPLQDRPREAATDISLFTDMLRRARPLVDA